MDDRISQSLEQLFKQYYIHPDCINDIRDLILGSGNERAFFKLFAKNTAMLNECGQEVIKNRNFEKLKHAKDLYSMKFKLPKQNLRIIYTYKAGRLALLLCSFYERSDSREKYSKYIPVANKRLRDLEEKQWLII